MRKLLFAVLLVLLAACGQPATTGTSPTTAPTSAPAATPAPADTPAPAATMPAAETVDPAGQTVLADSPEAKALGALTSSLGDGTAPLQFMGSEPQEWSDGSLGCPQDGMMYAQVITPGFKMTFSDGTKTYTVHTNETGDQIVICDKGKPMDLEGAGS